MTFDVQGQGRSDMTGSHDADHFAKGIPAQDATHFVEDLEDAIGFFESGANPLRSLLDISKLGIAGHSLGATSGLGRPGAGPSCRRCGRVDNVDDTVKPRVPMLGMSADYYLDPTPYTSDPDPDSKATGFAHWKPPVSMRCRSSARGRTTSGATHDDAPSVAARIDTAACTRPPGSTSTSSTTRVPTRACSPTAGAPTRRQRARSR